jgi:hypothetical protein
MGKPAGSVYTILRTKGRRVLTPHRSAASTT